VFRALSAGAVPGLAVPPSLAASSAKGKSGRSGAQANEVVGVVDGIQQKILGHSDIVVSEVGLGTQRWCGTDFNSPDEELCHAFLDRAVLGSGVNLVDTAEQYPIPSGPGRPEGATEEVIGRWIGKGGASAGGKAARRREMVIASKITGGRHVTPKTIRQDCAASLERLGTDYLDVYMLHWPARYSPQANWGQSLNYDYEIAQDPYYTNPTSFQEIASAMAGLVEEVTLMGAPVLLDPSKLRHSICDDNRKKCCWILGLEVFRSNRDANCLPKCRRW